jgi:predicted NUDIX family NTP pyrophosphohydrolase
MTKQSAGILLFRRRDGVVEVLLAHPGGPFWAKKDAGVWSIPKGEMDRGETPEAAARREFREETSLAVAGELIPLGSFRQPSGKTIVAFAIEADVDESRPCSNFCRIEWPPNSGRMIDIPEIDRLQWLTLDAARAKIARGQRSILESCARVANSN